MGLKAIVKKNPLVYAAAKGLRALPTPFLRLFMTACHAVRGVEKHKVYFSSFSGKLYNENPKYVCEALLKLCPEAKLVFRLDRDGLGQEEIPDRVIRVPRRSPAALYHMATARVIVKNAILQPYMTKFSDQCYIQLWHGDRGLKKILLDRNPDRKLPDRAFLDLAVSASDLGTQAYLRRGFGFKGEVLQCGYPKNDLLLSPPPGMAADVRRELGIPGEAHCLLYAPTFRDASSGSPQQAAFSLRRLQQALEAGSGEKWIMLTRGHNLNTGVAADAGMDVSSYPDVSRLLLITDMLITDYSSICGDYMLLKRPIILFHGDRAAYDRDLIFDPESSPYKIAHSEEELIALALSGFDAEENCRALADFYGMTESGRASEIVAERIRDIITKE